MAGTTKQVRSRGTPESVLYVLQQELNNCVDDLETIRDAVNTANGGAINITAASLVAAKITYTVG